MIIINYNSSGWVEPLPKDNAPIIVALDSCLLSTHIVKLPNMSYAKAKNAVIYALEDSLLENIDKLNFFVNKTDKKNHWAVIVVSNSIMDKLRSDLHTANITPVSVLPSFMLLPTIKDKISYKEQEDNILFRSDKYQGGDVSADIFFKLYPDEKKLQMFESIDTNYIDKFNLLQINFLDGLKKYLKPWTPVFIMALIVFIMATVQIVFENKALSAKVLKQTKNNEKTFRALFPNVKKIIDLQKQSTQELKLLSTQQTLLTNDLLFSLSNFKPKNNKAIKSLRFTNNKLDVDL